MNKTIKIILYVVILLCAYFIISMMYKSCNNTANDTTSTEEEIDNTEEDDFFKEFDSDEESETTDTEDEIEEEEIDYEALDDKLKGNDEEEEPSYEEPEKKVVRKSTPAPSTKTVEKPRKVVNSNSNGVHMIVAGSFLVENNAYNLVKKLKKLGYESAEVARFDESRYYTVIAKRTNSRSDANASVSSLKNAGVDCYVHRRQ